MRLFKRHRDDESGEAPCPRCGVPVPSDALECAVCGWDPRDTYAHAEPATIRVRPDTEDED